MPLMVVISELKYGFVKLWVDGLCFGIDLVMVSYF